MSGAISAGLASSMITAVFAGSEPVWRVRDA